MSQRKHLLFLELDDSFIDSEKQELCKFFEQELTKTGAIVVSPPKGSARKKFTHLTWTRIVTHETPAKNFSFSLSTNKPEFKINDSTNKLINQILSQFASQNPHMKNKIHQSCIHVIYSIETNRLPVYFTSDLSKFDENFSLI